MKPLPNRWLLLFFFVKFSVLVVVLLIDAPVYAESNLNSTSENPPSLEAPSINDNIQRSIPESSKESDLIDQKEKINKINNQKNELRELKNAVRGNDAAGVNENLEKSGSGIYKGQKPLKKELIIQKKAKVRDRKPRNKRKRN